MTASNSTATACSTASNAVAATTSARSQIPLAERFREAKPLLTRELEARINADAARARYQARNERLERLEAEHRAKLAEKRGKRGS